MYHWLLVSISVSLTCSASRNVTSDISAIIKLIYLHWCNLRCCTKTIKTTWKHLKLEALPSGRCCLCLGEWGFPSSKELEDRWWLNIFSWTNGRNIFECILIKIRKVGVTENFCLLLLTCVFLAVQKVLARKKWRDRGEARPGLETRM